MNREGDKEKKKKKMLSSVKLCLLRMQTIKPYEIGMGILTIMSPQDWEF